MFCYFIKHWSITKKYQSNEMMSWLLKRRHGNIDKETMKLRTQCFFQNNILQNRPSNREKKKKKKKKQAFKFKSFFSISLKYQKKNGSSSQKQKCLICILNCSNSELNTRTLPELRWSSFRQWLSVGSQYLLL